MHSNIARSVSAVIVVSLALACLAAPVRAHHGANQYDTTKAVELKGVITKFEWGNPHNQIFFDVTDDKGNVAHWVASTEPPLVMMERGWTRKAINAGDKVTVFIFAARNGATVGNLQRIVLPSGKELTAR